MKDSSDSGVTLVEVLISTAVASLVLAGAAGLLVTSARAVADSELETTATWVASRTIEEWRSQSMPSLAGAQQVDRDGQSTAGAGLFQATWVARPEPGGLGAWRVTATVMSPRLRHIVSAEAVMQRGLP